MTIPISPTYPLLKLKVSEQSLFCSEISLKIENYSPGVQNCVLKGNLLRIARLPVCGHPTLIPPHNLQGRIFSPHNLQGRVFCPIIFRVEFFRPIIFRVEFFLLIIFVRSQISLEPSHNIRILKIYNNFLCRYLVFKNRQNFYSVEIRFLSHFFYSVDVNFVIAGTSFFLVLNFFFFDAPKRCNIKFMGPFMRFQWNIQT